MSVALKKFFSNRGQISLEFSVLILAVITAAILLGYHLIVGSKTIQESNIETINNTHNTAMDALSEVS
uniref:Class III signal peptide n=1 Tax=Methanococcus maripaludis (strain C6 / ATCC BAA-1332) TaxID=444158 RepID=A9AA31_METM6